MDSMIIVQYIMIMIYFLLIFDRHTVTINDLNISYDDYESISVIYTIYYMLDNFDTFLKEYVDIVNSKYSSFYDKNILFEYLAL